MRLERAGGRIVAKRMLYLRILDLPAPIDGIYKISMRHRAFDDAGVYEIHGCTDENDEEASHSACGIDRQDGDGNLPGWNLAQTTIRVFGWYKGQKGKEAVDQNKESSAQPASRSQF